MRTRPPFTVWVLGAVVLLYDGYEYGVYGAALPFLLQRPDWAFTPEYAGLIGSLAVVGMVLGGLVGGPLTDYLGWGRVLPACVLLHSSGSVLCALAPSPEWLLAGRVLVGLGVGAFTPTAQSMIMRYSPPGRKSFNFAVVATVAGAGGAVAALAALWVAPAFGYQALFWLGALPLPLVVSVLVPRFPRSVHRLVREGTTETRPASPLVAPRALLDRTHLRATLLFWLAGGLALLLTFAATTWLPTIMIQAGYGLGSSLVFLALMQLGAAAGSFGGGLIADRRGSKGVVLVTFGCAVLALAAIAAKPPAPWVHLLVLVVGAGSIGSLNLLMAYIGIYYPDAIRGSGLGLVFTFGRLLGAAGPAIGGLLLAGGATAPESLLVFAAAPLLAIGVLAFGPPVSPAGPRAPSPGHRPPNPSPPIPSSSLPGPISPSSIPPSPIPPSSIPPSPSPPNPSPGAPGQPSRSVRRDG
ncbi:aromatic acid/H+ symport family MFS transporter [Pseudonocardia eucalypti]|uniref:Aromatic acid/H+ symport family MFS transporter n=1 Tax=Pseudonocardia eucalypti TaxID=648755 RepID=A0ABP9PFY3_9PSEU|nr:AAHS family benzoate transporter-like MFS transporter [Pseudonocardia eucalypti]